MEEVCMENAAYQLNTKIIPIFFCDIHDKVSE